MPYTRCAVVVMAMLLLSPCPALTQPGVLLSGVILAGAKPVVGASVSITGGNVTLIRTTDVNGYFTFPSIAVGTYTLKASSSQGTASQTVEVGAEGAYMRIVLLKTLASVTTTSGSMTKGAGTDVLLGATALQRLPVQGSLPETLLQLPGAARGANGVIHVNGDHGDINYIIDGLPIPQELNREIGTEIDPEDISFVEVLEGAYPAQYGGRFASVVNINTRVAGTTPGASGYLHAGSFAEIDSSLGWHTKIGAASVLANLRGQRSDRFLDPPNFKAVHDEGSNTNQFLRYTSPLGKDVVNLTFSHSYQSFQLPNDVEGGERANTDDNETQDDTFLAAQYHHVLRGNGALSLGIGVKRSRLRDLPDRANDFNYGESLNIAAGGSKSDCANGTVSACAYSLYSDRTARDIEASIDDVIPSQRHTVRFGGLSDATGVEKLYNVTLQPHNFLAPVLTPGTPNEATTVSDDSPNVGHSKSAYVQDTWQMGALWTFDYGLRYDFFSIASTQFNHGFGQVSPRVKLTRVYSPRASAYVFLGRFFTPFSLENVSPAAAQELNLPLQPTPAQFDLRPQRDTNVEIGAHLPLGHGELGLRVMQKLATDLIDDTQVGVTALHQDINYARGNISVQSAYYQQNLVNAGRAYVSLTHARAVNRGCETQLLAPCFGQPLDWTPADHDQNWDASAGILINDLRGGWLAIDGEYGSGLSSDVCAPTILFCKVPPHTTFDVVKGMAITQTSKLTVRVRNIFNDRYRITFHNAQGDHYAAGRTFEIGWEYR